LEVKGAEKGTSSLRGVDIRAGIQRDVVSFTSLSGEVPRFEGYGSTVAMHFYWYEKPSVFSTIFLSSRAINLSSQNLSSGRTEGVQFASVAPGVEFGFGHFFCQSSFHIGRINDYYVSTNSQSKSVAINGIDIGGGINFRFKKLGFNISANSLQVTIPGGALATSSESNYSDLSYSINLIYYVEKSPSRFFRDLF
jgi:hypothetical protein